MPALSQIMAQAAERFWTTDGASRRLAASGEHRPSVEPYRTGLGVESRVVTTRNARRAILRTFMVLEPRLIYAQALLAQGHVERAADALVAAVIIAPTNAEVRYRLGIARQRSWRPRDAEAAFRGALRVTKLAETGLRRANSSSNRRAARKLEAVRSIRYPANFSG